MTRLIRPGQGAEVELLTDAQRSFSAQKYGNDLNWLALVRTEEEDCTFPQQVEFLWESDAEESLLEIAEDGSFSQARRFRTRGTGLSVGNFKAGQVYFWRVNGGETRSFRTEDAAPRWVCVDGVSNVRDLGAWRTQDGGRIRQGLIFRGGEMDTHMTVTEQGLGTLREELCIRTDLDIRGEAVGRLTESPMGPDVQFLLIPARAYGEFLNDGERETTRRIFSVFAEPDNYPVYFHCWGGADRTGTIALLLQAVLGAYEEDMLRDYELTSLSVWGGRSRRSELFVSLLNALERFGGPGDSLNAKAERYLLSCGVTAGQIQRIREIMLERE